METSNDESDKTVPVEANLNIEKKPSEEAEVKTSESVGKESTPLGKQEIKKEETQPKVVSEPVKQAPQQEGGWGWGGWWNAASSAVTQSVSTLSDAVREMVVDEPEEKKGPQLYRRDEPPKPVNPNSNEDTNPAQNPEDLDLLSVVDKGFTMLGDGVDKLGLFLGQGITKVAETANLNSADIQHKAMDYAVSSYNIAKQVANSTTEKATNLGEKFANQSVDALESVGKKALGYLTVEEHIENKRRIRPVFNYAPQVTQMTKEEQESFEDVLNKNYFDESNGTAHLQELEKLSIECTLKYQKVEQKLVKLDNQHRDEVNALLNKVKELFDEDENEEKKLEVTEVELNEPATKHKEIIDTLAKSANEKASELVEAYKAELRELKPEGVENSIVSATDICHLTASYLDKTLLESVRRLSQFSASSVEQLLRIVESYLIEADVADSKDGKKMDKQDFIRRVAFAYSVTEMLSEELNTLSNAFIEAMRTLCEAGKSNFEEYGKKGDAELAESKKCTEDLESKLGLHENHIYLDTSNAISNIEECRKFLFPICKSLVSATLTLPEESQK